MTVPRVRIEDVLVEVANLRRELAELEARKRNPRIDHDAVVSSVNLLLDQAEQAATGENPPPSSWRLARFWNGRHLEASYPRLHAARGRIIGIYDASEVTAAVPAVRQNVALYLDRGDPRRIEADRLPTVTDPDERRRMLQAAMAAGYDASDQDHRRQRMFRNALIVATGFSLLLLGLLTGLMVLKPQFAPVCFDSVRQEGVSTSNVSTGVPVDSSEKRVSTGLSINCPSGAGPYREPGAWDAPLLVIFGIVGASLSAAVTVRNLAPASSVYDVPLVLSVLKLPLGALTAVIGVMAIKGGLVPGLSALDSPAEILVYAVVLGYAQQLATGILDRRAGTLGGNDR